MPQLPSSPLSPMRSPRRSLSGGFPGFSLTQEMAALGLEAGTSRQPVAAPSSDWTRFGYPPWGSLRRGQSHPRPIEFQISLQPGILDYSDPYNICQIEDSFNEAKKLIKNLRVLIERLQSSQPQDILVEVLAESMSLVVFGSNQIERVGRGLDETLKICREIFLEQRSVLEAIPVRSADYQRKLEEFIHQQTSGVKTHVIRERREVVNHAAAFVHIVKAFVKNNEPISEELIKDTHRILVNEISAGNVRSQHYAGKWRTQHVSAGETNFVNPTYIPVAMKRFLEQLNEKLQAAEEDGRLDPFYIASFACSEFVMIHPFLDGNGRTCRLLLNAILLKYAGVCASIGEHDQDRRDYLAIAQRRSSEECGPGELSGFTAKRSLESLRNMVARLEPL